LATYINSKKYEGVQYYIKGDGTKSYYVRYKDEENRLKRVKIGDETDGTTEVYCKNKRIEILNAQNKGEQPPKIVKQHRKKILTLDDVAKKYFETMENTNSTFERLSKYNKHLLPVLGKKSITMITKDDLTSLQNDCIYNKGLQPKTSNTIIELFGTIFNFGFREELYEAVNPTSKIKKPKIKGTRERFLNKQEIYDLLAASRQADEEKSRGNAIELFVRLALSTGARMEGLLHIKRCDVDLQTEIIRIVDFKSGGTVYSGYITETSREILYETCKKLKFNDYVISFNFDGKKITGRQLQTRLKPILDRLFNDGLDIKDSKNRVVIHSLRHTFASQLAIANTSLRQIQDLMHHADISQTMKYAKLQDSATKKAVQTVF
jgi:site-specific recombinase XerD